MVGTSVVVYVEVRDRDGDLVDPATLTLRLLPEGLPELPPINLAGLTKTAVGTYEYEFIPDSVGIWWARWQSTTPTTVVEKPFTIAESRF